MTRETDGALGPVPRRRDPPLAQGRPCNTPSSHPNQIRRATPTPARCSAAPAATASTVPIRKVTVSGDDPAVARQNYERAYDGSRFTVTRGTEPFSFQWVSIGDDRVSLRTATMTGHVTGETPGLTDYVVSWVQTGGGWIVRRDGQRMEIPRSPFVLPFHRPYTVHLTPHRQNSVLFSAPYLEDIATEIHAGPSQRCPSTSRRRRHPRRSSAGAWR